MKTLFILLGPTGVGKTELSLSIAGLLNSPIINADSRQLYRDLPIGTAAPTEEQQRLVKHYFVGTLGLDEYFSAAKYESEATSVLMELFKTHDNCLLTGGSMMYIDALYKGIDDLPTIHDSVRQLLKERLESEGLQRLLEELSILDPAWYEKVDRCNPRRVVHALEVCIQTGKPYSSFLGRHTTKRPYRIIKIGLQRPREELYERINKRVDEMIESGLLDEAKRAFPFKAFNSLNTVGYKELFNYFEGTWDLALAIEKIKRNSRVYSRKQMTWFTNDSSIVWFHPNRQQEILQFVQSFL